MSLCDIGTHKYNKARHITHWIACYFVRCRSLHIYSRPQIAVCFSPKKFCAAFMWEFARNPKSCFLCVHYFLTVVNNSIRNSSAGNKFTNLKSLRYGEVSVSWSGNQEVERWTTAETRILHNKILFFHHISPESYSNQHSCTGIYTHTRTPAIHIYRNFNRIQNITLNATDLLFTPFTPTIWIYANQWARNTCKILESMPLFHSHKLNQIHSASAISSIVWSVIFWFFTLLLFQSEYSTRVKWSAWCFCISWI